MARVLFVTGAWPWPADFGGAVRVNRLVQGLSGRHSVTVYSAGRSQPAEDTAPSGGAVFDCDPDVRASPSIAGWWAPFPTRALTMFGTPLPDVARDWFTEGIHSRLSWFRRAIEFDIVWARGVYCGEAARRAGFDRIILDSDDVPSAVLRGWMDVTGAGRSRWRSFELSKTIRYERTLSRRFQRVVVAKNEDATAYGGASPRIVCLPNGVDTGLGCIDDAGAVEGEILFVGTLDYFPNVDAIEFLASDVLPRVVARVPRAHVVVVGKGSPRAVRPFEGAALRVRGFVPHVMDAYRSASVVVAPVRIGSGTKLKVLEALAYGKALVATSEACKGIDLVNGVHAMVCDTADDLAAACSDLLGDEKMRRAIGGAGRQLVMEKYSWSTIGERACDVVDDVFRSR